MYNVLYSDRKPSSRLYGTKTPNMYRVPTYYIVFRIFIPYSSDLKGLYYDMYIHTHITYTIYTKNKI